MEASFKGAQKAFGAVGFVNQANDSDEHKKKAKNKFTCDLIEALKAEPRPEVFIFFTNVNLTVGEKDELVVAAKGAGLSNAEVFDRERIRISLDGRDGLHIRFQFLGIPLSEAEQAVFFARWGDDIQGVIAEGFGKIQKSLNRILFLQEASLHLSQLTCVFTLDREYTGTEIGHFRVFGVVYLIAPSNGLQSFIFGATDNSGRMRVSNLGAVAQENFGIAQGICGAQWDSTICDNEAEPNSSETDSKNQLLEKYVNSGNFSSIGRATVKTISIRYRKDAMFFPTQSPKLLELDGCWLVFFLNQTLAQKVQTISIYGNEYKLTEIEAFSSGQPQEETEVPLLI